MFPNIYECVIQFIILLQHSSDIVVVCFIYPFSRRLLYFPFGLFGFPLSHHLLYLRSYHIYRWSRSPLLFMFLSPRRLASTRINQSSGIRAPACVARSCEVCASACIFLHGWAVDRLFAALLRGCGIHALLRSVFSTPPQAWQVRDRQSEIGHELP